MTIPLTTTTITVRRPSVDANRDPYEEDPSPVTVAEGVRAHISSPSGREQAVGGEQSIVTFPLVCDPVDLQHTDTVIDESDDAEYEVVWVLPRQGFGLDHVKADLKKVTGVSSDSVRR